MDGHAMVKWWRAEHQQGVDLWGHMCTRPAQMRNKPQACGGTVLWLYHPPSLTSLYMRIPGCSYHLALFHLPLYLESCINNKKVNLHLITYSLELQMHQIYRAITVHVIIQLTKCTKYTTLRVNSNVSYGLWMLMIYQPRLVSLNKCTTPVGMLIMEEAMQQVYGKPLYLPLNFAVNLKLLFKKS